MKRLFLILLLILPLVSYAQKIVCKRTVDVNNYEQITHYNNAMFEFVNNAGKTYLKILYSNNDLNKSSYNADGWVIVKEEGGRILCREGDHPFYDFTNGGDIMSLHLNSDSCDIWTFSKIDYQMAMLNKEFHSKSFVTIRFDSNQYMEIKRILDKAVKVISY